MSYLLPTTQSESQSPAVLVVPAALQELAECGDAELVEELIAIFQTDTASRLITLERALAAGDHHAVRVEAHTIKGGAAQMGANRVADFCRQMELEAQRNPPAELVRLFARLLESFDEVCDVIAAQKETAL